MLLNNFCLGLVSTRTDLTGECPIDLISMLPILEVSVYSASYRFKIFGERLSHDKVPVISRFSRIRANNDAIVPQQKL